MLLCRVALTNSWGSNHQEELVRRYRFPFKIDDEVRVGLRDIEGFAQKVQE